MDDDDGHESALMKKLSRIFLVVCLVFAVVGFSDIGSSIFSGFCRAMGAVFFILTFITRVIEIAEAEEAKSVK